MSAATGQIDKYVVGIALVLAMVVGGGTRPGLITDSIIEIATILACAFVLSRPAAVRVPGAARMLALFAVVIILIQIIPLPQSIITALRHPPINHAMHSSDATVAFISLGLGHTMRALLVMVTLTMFFLAVSQLRAEQILGLIPFFFMGVICNAIAGAIQFSIADQVVIDDLLSYRISAGFFANINHFSSLLFITIPFLVYFGVVRGRTKLALLGLGGVLLMLLAAGSRAGVAMGFLILLASLIFLLSRSRATVGVVVTLFAGISIYGMGAWTKFESEFSNSDALRFEFVRTTWQGIKENWLLGVGYGNFEQAYQIYEKPEQIFRYFVNHAHNEYVQLVFEGGILSALLIGFYLILLHVQLWRSRADGLRKVAYLAVLFLLLHSLVDYPLRTFALVFPFVFFNAILFYLGSFSTKPMRDPVGEIDVDDEKLFHTAEIADVRDI